MKNLQQGIENITEKYYFQLNTPETRQSIIGEIKIYLNDLVQRGELESYKDIKVEMGEYDDNINITII